ncbi:MAG TPA: isochorismatase family cysteine hydrolase [Chloroflexota bacterium]|jgi:nicotinamidase-related amidase
MSQVIKWQEPWPGAVPSLEIDADGVGLIVVDIQGEAPPESAEDRFKLDQVLISNISRLLSWFRAHERPIIYLRVGSFLPDAEDQHAKRRLSWGRWNPDLAEYRRPVGSPDYAIRPEIEPLPGELIIDKNTSGAFNSSAIDHYLHQLGLRTLVVTGVQTYACVDATARDAADRGYNVILAADACSAGTTHAVAEAATLRTFARYLGAVKTTDEVLTDLATVSGQSVNSGAAAG